MEQIPDIDQLVAALIDGTISHSDLQFLKDYTKISESNRADVQLKIQLSVASGARRALPSFDTEKAIARFYNHIDEQAASCRQGHTHDVSDIQFRKIPIWTRWAAAAAMALMVTLPWAAYRAGSNAVKQHFADITLEAPQGSQLNLSLPDGTKVRLNSGSRISYSQGFGITDRRVDIEGEGFFQVKHDESLPFSVHTRELTVNDFGTEFCFRNYHDDADASVELYNGKITIDNSISHQDGYQLHPGDRVVMDKRTGEMVKSPVTTAISEAREMSKLHFENTTLKDIAHELSRSYDVEIKVDDAVAHLCFYGSFHRKTDTLSEILQALSSTRQFRFQHQGRNYIIFE